MVHYRTGADHDLIMEKTIRIGEQEVAFKATASTARRYRQQFGRDLLVDINKALPNARKGTLGEGEVEIFENLAYIMARQADGTVAEDPEEWLDQFEPFDMITALNEIVTLWGANSQTLESPKKKGGQRSAR